MSELTFNKVTIGILNGLCTVVLHPSDTPKTLTLLQNTEHRYDSLHKLMMIEDMCNPNCIVKLVHHYHDNLCSSKMIASN